MHNTSPDRHYKRSSIVLIIGIGMLVIALIAAMIAGIEKGDLFTGLLSGIGAIGTLMAAYEAADASQNAADAARISAKAAVDANELAKEQHKVKLSISFVPSTEHVGNDLNPRIQTRLSSLLVLNMGSVATAIESITLWEYSVQKKFTYRTFRPTALPSNSSVPFELPKQASRLIFQPGLLGYGVRILTVHGTEHFSICWIEKHRLGVITKQFLNTPLPEELPVKPADAPI